MTTRDERTPVCQECNGSGHWSEEVDIGVGVITGCHCGGRALDEVLKTGCCPGCGGTGKEKPDAE